MLSGYDPSADVQNYESCEYCNGTGDREDWVRYEDPSGMVCVLNRLTAGDRAIEAAARGLKRVFKDEHSKFCNGCNVCHGKGIKMRFRVARHAGDIMPVADLLKVFDPEKHVPYALVDGDGWHAKGKMFAFGISEDSVGEKEWVKEVKRLLEKNKDRLAVVVDCHS